MPELPNTPDNQLAFKKAGYRRVMSGFSTAWLDLRPTAEELRVALKGKWRRNPDELFMQVGDWLTSSSRQIQISGQDND